MYLVIPIITGLILVIFIFIKYVAITNKENFANNYLSRIYFIVMEKYPERVQNIKGLIKTHGLDNAHIFPAIDGLIANKNLLLKQHMITPKMYEKLRPGAIGCAMSHVTLWKRLVESGEPYMVVLEDDLTLEDNFNQEIYLFLKHVPDDFDIAQIYLSKNKAITDSSQNQVVNKYVKTGYPQNGTVAYIVSRKGAIKLLEYCVPIYHAVDIMIRQHIQNGKLIAYIPTQKIVSHEFKYISSICKNSKVCGAFT
jgi:glycosyl transferase family 25